MNLQEMAKARGLEIAEESVKQAGELLIDVLKEVVKQSETPIDDMIFASLEDSMRKFVNEKADLINKADNE